MNLQKLDGFFFKEEDILDKLKCPSCSEVLTDPKILPCGKTICMNCLEKLFASDLKINEFKCKQCKQMHQIKAYPTNEPLKALLQLKPAEVYRNKSVEELKYNLKKIQTKITEVEDTLKYPVAKINEYCRSIRNQIDLATEKAKQKLDPIHDDLFEQVKLYEELRHFQFDDEHEQQLNEKFQQLKQTIKDVREFLAQNINYLKEFKTDEVLIQKSIEDSKLKLSQLENVIDSFEFYLDFYPTQAEGGIKVENLGQLLRTTYKTRRSLFDKNPLSLKLLDLPLKDHMILSIDAINERKLLVLSKYIKPNKTDHIYLNVINYECTLMSQQQFKLEFVTLQNILEVNAHCSNERVLICSKIHNELHDSSFYDLRLYDVDLKELASRLKFDHAKEIHSIEYFENRCYFLLADVSNKKYLAVYDDQFNELYTKGKNSLTSADPFYFSSGITCLKTNGFKFFLFDRLNMQLQIMNQKTGLIEEQLAVEGSEFSVFKKSFMFYKHPQKVIYFDLNGSKLTEVDLKGRAECFHNVHFTNNGQIICSSLNFDEILIFI